MTRRPLDMSEFDLAPIGRNAPQSGGFPLWAFNPAPVDHMVEFDTESDWLDQNPRGLGS